jgi:hypothetical protein
LDEHEHPEAEAKVIGLNPCYEYYMTQRRSVCKRLPHCNTNIKNKTFLILKVSLMTIHYLRRHEGLEDKTPAEASGIKVDGANKWITLIENARSHF